MNATNPKTALCLEDVDNLRLQNINLRIRSVEDEHARLVAERIAFSNALFSKYGNPGEENLTIGVDGSIARPAPTAPATKNVKPRRKK